jgi:hypothetical protein
MTAAANQRLQIRIGCVVDGGLDAIMEATEFVYLAYLHHLELRDMP